jgi:hypothetical protein
VLAVVLSLVVVVVAVVVDAACAPGCAAACPGSGPRFTTAELEHLNESVESVLPLGPMELEDVAELHAELCPTLNSCSANLKRKFKEMYNSTVPTGDPTCPPHIRHAKQIFILIQEQSNADNLEGELPDIGIEIDDLNNVNNEGAQVKDVQEETEDKGQATRPRQLFEAVPNARPLVRTPVSARRSHAFNGNGLSDLTAVVLASLASSTRAEPVDREERRQAKVDRQKIEAEEREERHRAETEWQRSKAAYREEKQQDRQMNMMLMMAMISSMSPGAAAAMQPLQNAMMQHHCLDTENEGAATNLTTNDQRNDQN